MNILFIGYGNPGRADDGLGPFMSEEMEKLALSHVTVDSDYQLTVENSADVSAHDVVIFADASVNCAEPFEFKEIGPDTLKSFSTHSVRPEAVLGLARDMFKAKTKGFILAVRGYEFNEFREGISAAAAANAKRAVDFLAEKIRKGEIHAFTQ